ncbi:MAG: carboxypeptidase, partial [Bacillota bacterium]
MSTPQGDAAEPQERAGGPVGSGGGSGDRPAPWPAAYARLRERLAQVADLEAAGALLSWDEEVYMPPGGAEARAEQKATIGRLAHELFTAPEVGEWLEELREWEATLDPDSTDAGILRVTRREYERARKVPSELVAELLRAGSQGYHAWVEARQQRRFAPFAGVLAR